MKKLLLILCLFSMTAHAGWFDKKLTVYGCPNAEAGKSCSNKCTKLKEVNVNFLVDKSQKTVLKKVYLEGRLTQSETFQNCKIFNEDNWDCSKRDEESLRGVGLIVTITEDKMADGIYMSAYKSDKFSNTTFNNILDMGHCAK